jgi:hypothetical protein
VLTLRQIPWVSIAVGICLTGTEAAGQTEAVKKQIEAAKRQTLAVSQRQITKQPVDVPWISEPAPELAATINTADCDPIDFDQLKGLVTAAATEKVSAQLINAVIRQESGNRPCAVSVKGAMGLMQLMPETARELTVADPFDPAQNIQGGARYLGQLLERYNGDLSRALAAYNAGPARVDAANGIPNIAETQSYVKSILAKVQGNASAI